MAKKTTRPDNNGTNNDVCLANAGSIEPETAALQPGATPTQGRGGTEVTPNRAGDAAAVPLVIEPEPAEQIHVGAGGRLLVPREELDADLDDGTEIDLVGGLPKKIRRPDRREWFALKRDSELSTRMLLHKPKADGIEVEHYYVAPALRGPIRDELKDVRVFLFYSFKTKGYGLWVVNVTLENSWYESLHQFFQQPATFFAQNAVRVISDKGNSRYRIKYKPLPADVAWPEKTTSELLGEALGPERFITSAAHPVYRDLIEGVELS